MVRIHKASFEEMNTNDVGAAMVAAGHDFTVNKVPLTLPSGKKIHDKMAAIRTDTGQYLGTVGRAVKHIQPEDFYDMAYNLIQSTGGMITKTITLSSGAVIGISFELDRQEYIPGDEIALNFLMLTSYDSSYAIMGRAISHRFACMNQLPSSTKLFNIKNTQRSFEKVAMATKMLQYYGKEMRDFNDRMKLLVDCKMTDHQAVAWFKTLIPEPKKRSGRSETIYINTMDKFDMLLQIGQGTGISGVRGTAYGALNALTEYCNHERTTRVAKGKPEEQVRFESTVLGGSSDQLMATGFKTLVGFAAAT